MSSDAEAFAERLLRVREQIALLTAEETQLKRLIYDLVGEGGSLEVEGCTVTAYTRSTREYDMKRLAELYPGLYPEMLAKPRPRIDARKFDALVEAGGIDVDKVIEAGALSLRTTAPTVRVDQPKEELA